MVGEFASGELVTPLVKEQWLERNQESEDGKRYVAKLTEDLKDKEGNVAIASGSLMALEILSVDGASYAQVQVTSIIRDNTEYPISAGAITVQGEGGRPLIAQQYKDKGGEIAQYDLTVGLVSGLGKVGEIINQPDIQDEIEDELLDGTIRRRTRVNNSRRNISGAILEGAFGSLSDIIGRRAETSTQEILARPNVWYIPRDTKVTFQVNRTLELP
ncbi:TrbI/VirB10 family protein [Nodularia spumigena CS-586/05]|uniref:TrbI/VirB10 family protein n=1 Tax=Nodularia spumigena TaxID=70799 RepID=UPI00232BC813|nr:TrbI/VirB10 family protein [Nodularia spumigena]MDB9370676.1 TrbI/VirB10 family protein [Nodularia spumigena CS-586/05]